MRMSRADARASAAPDERAAIPAHRSGEDLVGRRAAQARGGRHFMPAMQARAVVPA